MNGISVVIPLYNKANEIRRSLDSIAGQTVQPDEVIVVDDGSTDGSADAAMKALRDGMRVVRQSNQGAAVARNTGIHEATGSLIAFLDADDEWHPEFLSEILRLKRAFPNAGAFCTAAITDRGSFRRFRIGNHTAGRLTLFGPGEGFKKHYGSPARMWSSAVAIKREVFQTVGYFRPGVRTFEDVDMWFRVACVFPVAFSRVPRAIWYWTAANRSTSLLPNEEDVLKISLRELIERWLMKQSVLPKAEMWMRRFNFLKALAIARVDLAAGLRTLQAWRDENAATLEWRLHYMFLRLNPTAYWSLRRCGSGVKDVFRWLRTQVRTTFAPDDRWNLRASTARK